jgi:hypothetical protein
MISVTDIISEAARHGVTMSLDNGRLALHAEAQPPDDLLDKIQNHTSAIIRHLMETSSLGNVADFSPADLFADNVRKSLLCHSEILDHPFDPEDFRMARIKSDTATSVLTVAARGSPDDLKIKRDGSRMPSAKLLAAVARADAMAEEDRRRDAEKAARDAGARRGDT